MTIPTIPGKIRISGTGCALADYLYSPIGFDTGVFHRFRSERPGDGGLSPGRLVFTEELENFAGIPYERILHDLTGGVPPVSINVGGPGIVPLIHAAQLLQDVHCQVAFHGGTGPDSNASFIRAVVGKAPIDLSYYRAVSEKVTPFTHVFSDPAFDDRQGERTFVNNIGAAWDYTPDMPGEEFFRSDVVCFGGTALVPQIHDHLTELLQRARARGCLTIVNTVFDFRNEKRYPDRPWPLGETTESLRMTDLLIMDHEESLRISGCSTIDRAADFFIKSGVASFIITNGPKKVHAWSDGRLFRQTGLMQFPVSDRITEILHSQPDLRGDTTGCGDNFVGGAIAAIAWQLLGGQRTGMDLVTTMAWAIASGGFTCFYMGGTYTESMPGEKLIRVREIAEDYLSKAK